ncbi:MAG: hypothetical protein COA69_11225 [Robiginitomaculum sp.]|nr:MAG: hypothetical protein COA69_11225 [Robiginitomaculum sp.]
MHHPNSTLLYILISICIFVSALQTAHARTFTPIETNNIRVCTASAGDITPPDFSSPSCKTVRGFDIDPQNTLIWVKTNIVLEALTGPNGEPLALFVSGKMASEFYLNGHYIGHNGTPALDAETEIPGRMDSVFYPAQSLFQKGDNEIVWRASSHHGFLKLKNPIHYIAIDVAGNTTNTLLRHYWTSLITLGIFMLGALYFGVAGLIEITGANGKKYERKNNLTLCLICTFAAAQLLTEVYRGLTAYPYPVHDIRLILITFFSAGFGLSITLHILNILAIKHVGAILIGTIMLCSVGVFYASGFDAKAIIAMLIPLCISFFVTGLQSYQRKPHAFAVFLALLTFIGALIFFRAQFLDTVFFYLVASLLLILFIEQAFVLRRETRNRRAEEARANQLELALGQAQEREEASQINIKSAGKMERISTDQIVHCQGASGYAEIFLADGREFLHSSTLAEMETSLPTTFLRVHRSHLVNTAFIKTLTRDHSGTGALVLTDGSEIPVSRRIMPQVRQALI